MPFAPQAHFAGVPDIVAAQGSPAGFWIRLVAWLVDLIIASIVGGILGAVLNAAGINFGFEWFTVESTDGESSTFRFEIIPNVLSFLIAPILLSTWGTTVGKVIFNIYVFDRDGKTPISFPRALLRELATFLSGAIFLIGYIMVAFRADRRALHDLIAGTFPIVRRKAS